MTVLHDEAHSLDISSDITVLDYTNDTGRDLSVMVKVELGDTLQPILGGGYYLLNVYLDDVIMLPASSVSVAADLASIVLQSRHISLEENQRIVVMAKGQSADMLVTTHALLFDLTPIVLADIRGKGTFPVDHDFGGIDNLRVLDINLAPVGGASIVAYLASDYLAGNRGPGFIQGQAISGADGRWLNPILLFPGTYTLLTSHATLTPVTTDITVT